jgi:SAM-dependent methyltransferase
LLLDLGVQRYTHRAVLKVSMTCPSVILRFASHSFISNFRQQKINEWRVLLRQLKIVDLLSSVNGFESHVPPVILEEMPDDALSQSHRQRVSMTGFQAARLFEMAVRHAKVCPATAIAVGNPEGIPEPQALWYESAHDDGVKRAEASNDVVSDTAVGNGWEYSDDDILGMVAPLGFELNDSIVDVGCGDGYFVERLARLLSELRVRFPFSFCIWMKLQFIFSRSQLLVMGVDLMQFSINTARARFLRIGLEFLDKTSELYRGGSDHVPCAGTSCSIAFFPMACVGSGLHMPWIQSDSFSKYISVYPINHFDDEGSEKLVRFLAV